MSKKQKVVMHPSSAVHLLEKICSFMMGKKIERVSSSNVVGKITFKPKKSNTPSGKITLTIKESSTPKDDLRA
jgi:hypothetical protein